MKLFKISRNITINLIIYYTMQIININYYLFITNGEILELVVRLNSFDSSF